MAFTVYQRMLRVFATPDTSQSGGMWYRDWVGPELSLRSTSQYRPMSLLTPGTGFRRGEDAGERGEGGRRERGSGVGVGVGDDNLKTMIGWAAGSIATSESVAAAAAQKYEKHSTE
jgi:hypothetical protein